MTTLKEIEAELLGVLVRDDEGANGQWREEWTEDYGNLLIRAVRQLGARNSHMNIRIQDPGIPMPKPPPLDPDVLALLEEGRE